MQRYLTCLAAMLCLAVPAAWAQTRTGSALEPPDLERYLRWGPVRVRPKLVVRNFGYDDNIFSDTINEVSDYTGTIVPSVDGLILLGSRAFFEFEEELEYVTYVDNSDQSFLNQLGEGRLTVPFRRMGVYLDFELDRVEERPEDADDIRRRRDTNGLGAGIILLPGHSTEIEIGASRSDSDYSDKDVALRPDGQDLEALDADEQDRVETGVSLSARYSLKGRVWLTLDVDTESVDFDILRIGDGGNLLNADSHEWKTRVGVEFGERGRLSGKARVGWTDIRADDPTLSDFTDMVGDARLHYEINRRTTVSWNARRETSFSASGDTNYFLVTDYELRAVYYLNRAIGLEAGTEVGRLTFPDAPAGTVDDGREDDINRYDVGVRLRLRENSLGRRLEYRIKAGRYRRDSSIPNFPNIDNDLSRATFGLGLVVGF